MGQQIAGLPQVSGPEWRAAGAPATPFENEKVLLLRRWKGSDEIFSCFNFGKNPARVTISLPQADWTKALNSRDHRWAGPGLSLPECLPSAPNHPILIAPLSVALYRSDARGKT